MGNDGGSIPGKFLPILLQLIQLGRRDLVREKPKEVKIDAEIIAKARYFSLNFFIQQLFKTELHYVH